MYLNEFTQCIKKNLLFFDINILLSNLTDTVLDSFLKIKNCLSIPFTGEFLMKKSLLLLSSVLSFNLATATFAADHDAPAAAAAVGGDGVSVSSVVPVVEGNSGAAASAVASADDLQRIKAHIFGYAQNLGLPAESEVVGSVGCFAWCSTTFDAAEEFLLKELAGQLLARFMAIALDDLADGRLDGEAFGHKVSYAGEVGKLLGIDVSDVELTASPIDESLVSKLTALGGDVFTMIQAYQAGGQKSLEDALGAFAKRKMDKARKSLAVALIHEVDRIIELELANGAVDGLDGSGARIDYKAQMQQSVERSLRHVLYGTL